MANSVDPDQILGAVCLGSTLFDSILNSSVMLGNYLQQTTFSDAFFLGTLRVNFNTLNFVPTAIALLKLCQFPGKKTVQVPWLVRVLTGHHCDKDQLIFMS